MLYHEFCLGSFDNQYFINVLVRHEENIVIPECRLVFTVGIRDWYFSIFIMLCLFLFILFSYAIFVF